MKTQLILARPIGYTCAALIVNQVVVAEAMSTPEIERLVVTAAQQMSVALGVPLVECEVEVPPEMDGLWTWADLLNLLPPVEAQLAKHPFLLYCWSEGGVHPSTVDGPGDAWDELNFDTQPPVAGTPYYIMAPVHETSPAARDKSVTTKVLDDFRHWLNERREQDVSSVFHETVAMAESLIHLTRYQPDEEALIERVTMGILGKEKDPSPGINWFCNRAWMVNDARTATRRALEAAGIVEPLPDPEPESDSSALDL